MENIITILKLALSLLLMASAPNIPIEIKNQANNFANQAILMAQEQLLASISVKTATSTPVVAETATTSPQIAPEQTTITIIATTSMPKSTTTQPITPIFGSEEPIIQPKILFPIAKKSNVVYDNFTRGDLIVPMVSSTDEYSAVIRVFVKRGDTFIKEPKLFNIQVSTPDPKQNKTIKMDNTTRYTYIGDKAISPEFTFYAPFFYSALKKGTHTITFSSAELGTASIDLIVE